jgi:hypothetical protein
MQGSSHPISKTIGLVVFPLRNPNKECRQMLEYPLSKNSIGVKSQRIGPKSSKK